MCTFSGIGGFARGLAGIADVKLFCDIDGFAQQVLRSRFPGVPVHGDVHTLDAKVLKQAYHLEPGGIDLLLASFPCQSHSTANKNRKGMSDDRGGLFYQAMRLLKEMGPKLAFFENVAGILSSKSEWKQAILAAGYSMRYCVLPAYAVGAKHERMRWFCLCVRNGTEPGVVARGIDHAKHTFNFAAALPARTCSVDLAAHKLNDLRLRALSNAIVPDQARLAFCYLVSGGRVGDFSGDTLVLDDPLPCAKAQRRHALPEDGRFVAISADGKEQVMPILRCEKPNLGLVLDPKACKLPRPSAEALPELTKAIKVDLWATPTAVGTKPCNCLTQRSCRVLATQVRFEINTEQPHNPLSPMFVEALMGFPRNWTRVEQPPKSSEPTAAMAAPATAVQPPGNMQLVYLPVMMPAVPTTELRPQGPQTHPPPASSKGRQAQAPKDRSLAITRLKQAGWSVTEVQRPGTGHVDRVYKSPGGTFKARSLKAALEHQAKQG